MENDYGCDIFWSGCKSGGKNHGNIDNSSWYIKGMLAVLTAMLIALISWVNILTECWWCCLEC